MSMRRKFIFSFILLMAVLLRGSAYAAIPHYPLTITPEERAAIHARVDAISGDIGDNWGAAYDPSKFNPATIIGGAAQLGLFDRISRPVTVTSTYPFMFNNTAANLNELDRKVEMYNYMESLSKMLGFPVVVRRQDQNYVFVEFGDPDAPEMIMGFNHLDGVRGSISAGTTAETAAGAPPQLTRWRGPDGLLTNESAYRDRIWHSSYIRDGWLYAQGVNDGMGPTMATYYAAKAVMDVLNEKKFPLDRRIRVVLGGYEDGGGSTPNVANASAFASVSHYASNPSFYDNWAYKILNREEMPIASFTSDSRFPTVIGNAQQITRNVSMSLSSDAGKPFSLLTGTFGVTEILGDEVLGDIVYGSVAQVATKAVFTLDVTGVDAAGRNSFVDGIRAAAAARGWSTADSATELAKAGVRISGDTLTLTINTGITMESPSPHYAHNAIVWGMYLLSEALGGAGVTPANLQLKRAADGIADLFFRGGVEDYMGVYMGIPENLLRHPQSYTPNMTFAFGRLSTASAEFYTPGSGSLSVGMFIMNMFDNEAEYVIARDSITSAWEGKGFAIDGAAQAWSAQSMYLTHDNPLPNLLVASFYESINSNREAFDPIHRDLVDRAIPGPQGTTGGTYAGPYFNKMSTYGGIIPGNERWWHTANERIGTKEIVQMTKLMADGLLEMARYAGPAGAKFMWADIPGLDSSRADLDMLDVQLNTYKNASAAVLPQHLGGEMLLAATSFDIPMFRLRVTGSQSITAINAGHAANGIYLPVANIDTTLEAGKTAYVLPMRLEFKVSRPAGMNDAQWETVLASDINTIASTFSFNILNGGQVVPLRAPAGEADMFFYKRISRYAPDTLYVSVNLAIADDAYTGVNAVFTDSKTDLFTINPDYLESNPNPFPERGKVEKRGFFVFGDGSKNARFASPTAVYVTIAAPATGVTLNRNQLSLNAGGSDTLVATVTPPSATGVPVIWSSNNPTVATVNSIGLVTAIAGGTATITATTVDGGYTASCVVTVNVPPASVSLNRSSSAVEIGATVQLLAYVLPENATDKSVTWSSSAAGVATVNANGLVTAVSSGTATITATTVAAGRTATCVVTVPSPRVDRVTVSPATGALFVGDSLNLTATVMPDNAGDKSVAWTSSNPDIATVSASGQVTAVRPGVAMIIAVTNDGGKVATSLITVSRRGGVADQSEPIAAEEVFGGTPPPGAAFSPGGSLVWRDVNVDLNAVKIIISNADLNGWVIEAFEFDTARGWTADFYPQGTKDSIGVRFAEGGASGSIKVFVQKNESGSITFAEEGEVRDFIVQFSNSSGGGDSSSGGGCTAGYGYLAFLALMGAAPFVIRKRK